LKYTHQPTPWGGAGGGVVRILYRYLLCDSQANRPDPTDIRLLCLDEDELAEHRRALADVVALRRRLSDALHADEPVMIPRWRLDSYIWNSEITHVLWLADRAFHV
jgi:hypothetical protein